VECRVETSAIKRHPEQKCVVEIVNESAGFLGFFNGGQLADWEEVEESNIADDKISKMTFDLRFHFNLKPQEEGGADFDYGLSMASMKTGTSNVTFGKGNMNPDIVTDLANDGFDPSNLNSGHSSATGGNAATSAANAASAQQTGVSDSNK